MPSVLSSADYTDTVAVNTHALVAGTNLIVPQTAHLFIEGIFGQAASGAAGFTVVLSHSVVGRIWGISSFAASTVAAWTLINQSIPLDFGDLVLPAGTLNLVTTFNVAVINQLNFSFSLYGHLLNPADA